MVCILATNVTHICQFTKARGVVSTLTYIAWKAEGTHNSGDCHEKKPLMSGKSQEILIWLWENWLKGIKS